MAKRKKYIPDSKFNPVIQAKKTETLSLKISNLSKAIDALSKSYDTHISFLGNFARHDIKNSIQSMDSILSTNDATEITDEHLLSLKTNLKVIRETMDNFSQLVPYSQDERFTLKSLIIAVELLNRNTFHKSNITFVKDYPKETDAIFNLPFHAILQMLNNLIINAVKSLDQIENPQIKLLATIENEEFYLEISDNGKRIEEDCSEKIFEFGYSTTGGSGIGLFHAKYLCELFKGKIELTHRNDDFTKSFRIYLPVIK